MKHKIKSFLTMLCMVLSLVSLAKTSVMAAEMSAEELENYKSSAAQTIEAVTGFSDEEIEMYLAQATDTFSTTAITSWKDLKEDLGTFTEVTEQSVEQQGDQIVISSQAVFENGTATVTLTLESVSGQVSPASMNFERNYTMSEKMVQAGLNTVMGIGIVFLMLVFLCFVISLFKYISKLEQGKTKTEEKTAVSAPAASAPVGAQEEELVDDGELVAVIAAAIAASENTSTDSFRVRSIKKATSRRWRNA